MVEEGEGGTNGTLFLMYTIIMLKRQKDRTLKEELPRSVGAQYATEHSSIVASHMLLRSVEKSFQKERRDGAKAKTIRSCGCDW